MSLSKGLKTVLGDAVIVAKRGSGRADVDVPKEECYACGSPMTEIQTCKFRCNNCGAILDCEDVSGLPKL